MKTPEHEAVARYPVIGLRDVDHELMTGDCGGWHWRRPEDAFTFRFSYCGLVFRRYAFEELAMDYTSITCQECSRLLVERVEALRSNGEAPEIPRRGWLARLYGRIWPGNSAHEGEV